jgi:hypothetical protein
MIRGRRLRPLQGHGHDLDRLPAPHPVSGVSRVGRKATGMTQSDRVLAFLRRMPGRSAMELSIGLSPYVSNPRARISDLRKAGHVIECVRDEAGVGRFYLREQPEQMPLGIAS